MLVWTEVNTMEVQDQSLSRKRRACLICWQGIDAEDNPKLKKTGPEQILEEIGNVLGVTSSIYQQIDPHDLPSPLLCSACSKTVKDAVRLQDAIKTLQDQLSKLKEIIKRDFLREFQDDQHPDDSFEEVPEVESIRKTFVQCWAKCEVRVEKYQVLQEETVLLKQEYDAEYVEDVPSTLPTFAEIESVAGSPASIEIDPKGDLGVRQSESIDVDVKIEEEHQIPPPSPPFLKIESTTGGQIAEEIDLNRDLVVPKSEIITDVEVNENNSGDASDPETGQDKAINTANRSSNVRRNPSRSKPAECKICGRIFKRARNLKMHLERKKPCSKGGRIGSYTRRNRRKPPSENSSRLNQPVDQCPLETGTVQSPGIKEQPQNLSEVENSIEGEDAPADSQAELSPRLSQDESPVLSPVSGTTDTFLDTVKLEQESHPTAEGLESQEKLDEAGVSEVPFQRPSWNCTLCEGILPSKALLAAHHKSEHELGRLNRKQLYPKVHKCPTCGKGFTRRRTMLKHADQHDRKENLSCTLCSATFRVAFLLKRHMDWHKAGCPRKNRRERDYRYRCPICYKGFNRKTQYDFHTKQHENPDEFLSYYIRGTRDAEKNLIAFECKLCDERFPGDESVQSEGQVQIMCKHPNCNCNETFADLQNFLRHHKKKCTATYWLRGKAGKKLCEECGKEFETQTHLNVHIQRMHPKPGGFNCEHCGRVFGARYFLKEHLESAHGTEKKYQCHVCGSRHKTRNTLNSHVRLRHTEWSRNIVCDVCGRAFRTTAHLQAHRENSHSGSESKFLCKFCGIKFKSVANVQNHVLRMHKEEWDKEDESILTLAEADLAGN